MDVGFQDFLPIKFDALYKGEEPSFYVTGVPQGSERLLLGKLIAINGVPTEEVISRLTPYIPHENEFWLVNQFSEYMMTQLAALRQIGVVKMEETSAVLSLDTDFGMIDVTLDGFPAETYDNVPWLNHPMLDVFAYAAREDFYWYELLNDGKSLYIRFAAMDEDPHYPLNTFLGDVKKIIRESKEPIQIIFDFRGNGGGKVLSAETQSLIAGIIPYPSHSTFILIDSGSFSAAVAMPWRLSVGIPGAQLVGSPTGQGPNHFSHPITLTLPHSGHPFYLATQFVRNTDGPSGNAIQPNITVRQTPEDYRSCKDAVLEYILSLS